MHDPEMPQPEICERDRHRGREFWRGRELELESDAPIPSLHQEIQFGPAESRPGEALVGSGLELCDDRRLADLTRPEDLDHGELAGQGRESRQRLGARGPRV